MAFSKHSITFFSLSLSLSKFQYYLLGMSFIKPLAGFLLLLRGLSLFGSLSILLNLTGMVCWDVPEVSIWMDHCRAKGALHLLSLTAFSFAVSQVSRLVCNECGTTSTLPTFVLVILVFHQTLASRAFPFPLCCFILLLLTCVVFMFGLL